MNIDVDSNFHYLSFCDFLLIILFTAIFCPGQKQMKGKINRVSLAASMAEISDTENVSAALNLKGRYGALPLLAKVFNFKDPARIFLEGTD